MALQHVASLELPAAERAGIACANPAFVTLVADQGSLKNENIQMTCHIQRLTNLGLLLVRISSCSFLTKYSNTLFNFLSFVTQPQFKAILKMTLFVWFCSKGIKFKINSRKLLTSKTSLTKPREIGNCCTLLHFFITFGCISNNL